ncbi:hypothetical protein D3C80_1516520 [compost metagenome]
MNQYYQFGSPAIIPLQPQIKDDWADNLIGAQYLEIPKGSQTRVRITVRSVDSHQHANILLKLKEQEKDVHLGLPAEMVVTADQPLEMEFSVDNPHSRKALSLHLLDYVLGAVEVSDFSVVTKLPGQEPLDGRRLPTKPPTWLRNLPNTARIPCNVASNHCTVCWTTTTARPLT